MSNWVKITKAKQLRYKLISVMYLIFIALSIINIPIEWLHVNKEVSPLLTETTIVNIDNEDLNRAYQSVEQTKRDFYIALGYDEATGTYREPFGYSVTDAFFVSEGRGKGLQEALQEVHSHLDRLGAEQKALFNELFAEDVANGLLEDSKAWSKWKFKHVPASMAEVLLNELILRIRLVSGDLEFKGDKGGASNQSIVEYATNLDYLVFGDTLKVKSSLADINATVVKGADSITMSQEGEFLYFVPSTTGNHTLTLRGKTVEEQYTFTVLPAQISNRKQKALITYFEGAASSVDLGTVISGGSVNCSCDSKATYSGSTLRFTPEQEGWCSLRLRGANGVVLLNDSVYVQPAPIPYFKVKGLVEGDRLPKGNETLEVEAFHPSVPAAYQVTSITYEKLGTDSGEVTEESAAVSLTNYQGAIWIKKVVARSGDRLFESDQNFLITIEP